MFVIGNFFAAVAQVLHLAITIYMWIIIARVVVSWLSVDPYHSIVRFLYQATEPVLMRVRGILPPMAGLDLSPVIVIFVLIFLDRFLVTTLSQMATY
jgi:YggT family protein